MSEADPALRNSVAGLATGLDAQFAQLIEAVWACERWETTHPLAAATIRELASTPTAVTAELQGGAGHLRSAPATATHFRNRANTKEA